MLSHVLLRAAAGAARAEDGGAYGSVLQFELQQCSQLLQRSQHLQCCHMSCFALLQVLQGLRMEEPMAVFCSLNFCSVQNFCSVHSICSKLLQCSQHLRCCHMSCSALLQVLQGLRIEEHVAAVSQGTPFGRGRLFKLRLQFFPQHLYPEEAGITFADVAQVFKASFVPKLQVCVCTSSRAPQQSPVLLLYAAAAAVMES